MLCKLPVCEQGVV
jgi:hypothetical protein